jgi:hypothetical protein
MKISYLVMHWNRASLQPVLLNECVWWCLRNDDFDVEVIVLNDNKLCELWCRDRRVRCVNVADRYPDLGAKMAALQALATGDVCLINDDDDISLPNRIPVALKHLNGFDYFDLKKRFFGYRGLPLRPDDRGWFGNMLAFRRGLMQFPGGYSDYDQQTVRWARANLSCSPYKLKDHELATVYRWNVSLCHLSGYGNKDEKGAYDKLMPGHPGRFEIRPEPQTDWVAEARAVVPDWGRGSLAV